MAYEFVTYSIRFIFIAMFLKSFAIMCTINISHSFVYL
jgi:hypothetical protein